MVASSFIGRIWKTFNFRPQSSSITTRKPYNVSTSSSTECNEAEEFIITILEIVERLEQTKMKLGLGPGDEVNSLFGKLVGLCTEGYTREIVDNVMGDDRILYILPSLRALCAEGEAFLEMHSVKCIFGNEEDSDSESVFARLKAFPYYQNYIELTRLELAALYAVSSSGNKAIRKIAFIGSGPLPLSSLCLRDILDSKDSPFGLPSGSNPDNEAGGKESSLNSVTILNIDRDSEALLHSKILCQALGERGQRMEFWCADLAEAEDDIIENRLQDYDAVFLAALVGENQEEKERMIHKVARQMKEGGILVVRSADGMRALLYPEFDHSSARVRAVLEVRVILHPQNQVVNSVIVGRIKKKRNCV